MKKLMMVAACAAVFCGGCRAVKVENNGEEFLADKDGNLVLVEGQPVKCSKGWSVWHNSHWLNSEADSISASVKGRDGSEIQFGMNGLKSSPSEEFNKMMSTTFAGFASLARLAASMYSPGAASIPLTPEAADPDAVAKLVDAQSRAKTAEIAARADAKVKTAAATSSAASTSSSSSAAGDCTDGSCEVK